MAEDTTTAAAGATPPPGCPRAPGPGPPSPSSGATRCPRTPCSSRCCRSCAPPTPRPTCPDRAGLRRRRARPRGPEASLGRRLHHPPARGDHDPRRARHDARRRWPPRCCTTPSRTPPTASRRCAATSATRSRCSSTASPSSTRSPTARPPRPRRCARWSSRWRATSGCSSSSSPTGCTTPAPGATSRRRAPQRKAKETLEIYAPLAHRLGMNTIKWELEDLSFQALYPKVYDEIVRLVVERAPAREEYLAGVRERGQRRPARGQDQGHRDRSPQALLLRLPEDDRGGPRLRADLRPRRGAGARRDGARLLRGAGGAARAVEPRAGAVQGLHRDAEVQHVPVAAHDGHRPRRQAGRDPDPHPHDAPPGRVRRRRALEVQGGPGRQGHGQPGWRAGA